MLVLFVDHIIQPFALLDFNQLSVLVLLLLQFSLEILDLTIELLVVTQERVHLLLQFVVLLFHSCVLGAYYL